MSDMVKRFFDAWGEADKATQASMIAEALSADARYADPRTPEPLNGSEVVAGYVAQFTEMAPGGVADTVDVATSDGVIRATVEFRMSDGMAQLGQYFAEADADGKLTRLVGFVGNGAQ